MRARDYIIGSVVLVLILGTSSNALLLDRDDHVPLSESDLIVRQASLVELRAAVTSDGHEIDPSCTERNLLTALGLSALLGWAGADRFCRFVSEIDAYYI